MSPRPLACLRALAVAMPRGPGTRIERPLCPTGLRVCGSSGAIQTKGGLDCLRGTRGPELSVMWGRLLGEREGIRVCDATIPHGMGRPRVLPSAPPPHPGVQSSAEIPNPRRVGWGTRQTESRGTFGTSARELSTKPRLFLSLLRLSSHANGAGAHGERGKYMGIPYYSVSGGRYSAE